MRLTHRQKSDGFHPMWIVWPVLATFLIALLLALPTFYATTESESQHDLATPLQRQMLLQTRLARPINRKIETAAVVET